MPEDVLQLTAEQVQVNTIYLLHIGLGGFHQLLTFRCVKCEVISSSKYFARLFRVDLRRMAAAKGEGKKFSIETFSFVQVLVDYMTDEASLLPRDQIHSIVDTRIALLLRACCQRRDLLRAVTQHLYDKLKLNK